MTQGYMLADKNYEHRVREGKKRELVITARLRAAGHTVSDVTAKEDMHDKIDAVVDGRKAQYKFRKTGTDILFDYAEPFSGHFNLPGTRTPDPETKLGRDLVSKAELYVVMVGQRLWLAEKKAIVEVINKLLVLWITENRKLSNRYKHESLPGVELNWTTDHSNGRRKLVFFVHPLAVDAVEVA